MRQTVLQFLSRHSGNLLPPPPTTVAVLRLSGIIGQPMALRAGSLSLAGINDLIERAFSLKGVAAVALAVNSPGGSPVQSALIAKRIRALGKEKGIPVIAFAEDVAASGGYWLACAADEIFADENSIIGSIGVVSAGFGFQDLLARIGVERRVHTAGPRKAMLDPFRPEKPEDVERLMALQADIFESFKGLVRDRRGAKLRAKEEELFSGEFWTGKRALELGLIDGLGDLYGVMRQRYGDKVRIRVLSAPRGWLRRRLGFSGLSIDLEPVLAGLEGRAAWARYGL